MSIVVAFRTGERATQGWAIHAMARAFEVLFHSMRFDLSIQDPRDVPLGA